MSPDSRLLPTKSQLDSVGTPLRPTEPRFKPDRRRLHEPGAQLRRVEVQPGEVKTELGATRFENLRGQNALRPGQTRAGWVWKRARCAGIQARLSNTGA